MSETRADRMPEAAGPGVDALDGSVTYGVAEPARVQIPPPMPAWQRDEEMARRRDHSRCPRCLDVPDDIIVPVVRAIRDAREGRPPR
jgi:hypothetical protein